jgi:hypothetical protein
LRDDHLQSYILACAIRHIANQDNTG